PLFPLQMSEAIASTVARACGSFLPVPVLLRGSAASIAWRDGIEEALHEAEEVDLHLRNPTDAEARRLLLRCLNARHVNLCGCRSVGEGATSAVASSCPRLQELNVSCNPQITAVAIDEVVKGCPKLEALCLSGCDKISEQALTGRFAKFCDIFDEEEEGPWTA
ncbi:unnamed protein product, partial [Polarella glacialis]